MGGLCHLEVWSLGVYLGEGEEIFLQFEEPVLPVEKKDMELSVSKTLPGRRERGVSIRFSYFGGFST